MRLKTCLAVTMSSLLPLLCAATVHAQEAAGRGRDAPGDVEPYSDAARAVYPDRDDAWRGRNETPDGDTVVPLGLPAPADRNRIDDRARDDSERTYISANEVDVLYQPAPQNYQPDGNLDASDSGKSFAIDCTISGDGHLGNCYAEDNDLNDQNFVRLALANARQWVVAPQLHDGGASAGRTFRMVCRFDRLGDQTAPAIASNGR